MQTQPFCLRCFCRPLCGLELFSVRNLGLTPQALRLRLLRRLNQTLRLRLLRRLNQALRLRLLRRLNQTFRARSTHFDLYWNVILVSSSNTNGRTKR